MKSSQPTWLRAGFSLIEVVIAIGLVAFACTAILGVNGMLSTNSRSVTDRQEASRVLDAVSAYLRRSVPDAADQKVPSFQQIQTWATARQKLYAYRSINDTDPDRILISQTAPASSLLRDKMFVAEMAPASTSLVASGGNRSYTLFSVNLFAVSPGTTNVVDPSLRIGTYPMVAPQ